jgi:tRNA pseudouridine38-40 synthase
VSAPRRNVELKALDPDPERSLAVCRELGAEDRGVLVQRDTYFRARTGRLKLREEQPGGATLVQYARPDADEARLSAYRLVPVSDPGELRAALDATYQSWGDLGVAGRTDAGVHAIGQVASARLASPLDDETLTRALNANLPPTVRVIDVVTAADDFHARFSARSKTYEYRIWNGAAVPPFIRQFVWHVPQPLTLDPMQRAAEALVGEHDFAAFQGTGSTVHTTVRTVIAARWVDDVSWFLPSVARPPRGRLLAFEMRGEGFLRHMVRAVTGTLVEIGLGRRSADDIPRLLASRDRSEAGRTAPACGLFLMSVEY